MKKQAFLLLLAASLSLVGCKSSGASFGSKVDSALVTPTAWVTNHVEERVYVTNQVVVVTQTNELGAVTKVTNREPVQVVIPAHDDVKPIAFAPNTTTVAAISTVGSFIPGYGQLAAWLAVSGLGLYAKLKGKQYKDAAVSVAQGVEHFLAANPTSAPLLKRTLADVQADHGTTSTVRDILVNEVESRPKLA